VTQEVFIPSEGVWGEIVSLMVYGAIIRYNTGGFEFYEMLAEEDYIVMEVNGE
jgi:hypothetical protein